MADKEYLGDGIYIEMEHFGIVKLTTEDGISVQNTIVMEGNEIRAFINYIKRHPSIGFKGDM